MTISNHSSALDKLVHLRNSYSRSYYLYGHTHFTPVWIPVAVTHYSMCTRIAHSHTRTNVTLFCLRKYIWKKSTILYCIVFVMLYFYFFQNVLGSIFLYLLNLTMYYRSRSHGFPTVFLGHAGRMKMVHAQGDDSTMDVTGDPFAHRTLLSHTIATSNRGFSDTR